MQLTRLRIIAMLVLAVTSSSLLAWHFASAGPSPSVGRVVTPGAVGPCTWFISLDGTTPVAEAMVGGLSVSPGDNVVGTAGQSMSTFTQPLVSANENLCFGNGSFDFKTGQAAPSGENIAFTSGVGLILSSNDTITGLGWGTVLTSTTAITGSNDFLAMFTNANPSTSNVGIKLMNLEVNLPFPSHGVTLTAWDDCVIFAGVHDSFVNNVNCTNGGIEFQADSTYHGTANALLLGNNYDNIVSQNDILNTPGSNEFVEGTYDQFINNLVKKCWDDCFLVGAAGKWLTFQGNLFDASSPSGAPAAGNGVIRMNNDGSVDAVRGISNIRILNNVIRNGKQNNGGSYSGIIAVDVKNVTILGNTISDMQGNGIKFSGGNSQESGYLKISENYVYNNTDSAGGGGIYFVCDVTGTCYSIDISNNFVYSNGNSGIDISSNAVGDNLQDVNVVNNHIFNSDPGPTQTNGIRVGLAGTFLNIIISNNDLSRQSSGQISVQGSAQLQGFFYWNEGYNPIGKITNFVVGTELTPWGTGSAVSASTDYQVWGSQMYFTSSGGTGVSITIKDSPGNTIYAPGATLSVPFLMPVGNKINFGAFSVAPTVTVWFA